MTAAILSSRDLAWLSARGITPESAREQMERLVEGTRPIDLDRPALVGDGIHRLSDGEAASLADLYEVQRAEKRVIKFVPASGAASRMFAVPTAFLAGRIPARALPGGGRSRPENPRESFLWDFFSGLEAGEFAFCPALDAALNARGTSLHEALKAGEPRLILETLLAAEGLGYAHLPKALIPFHRRGGRADTPLDEHLAEAMDYGRGRDGAARLHFTVAPEFRADIEAYLRHAREGIPGEQGAVEVDCSVQDPATDTLALTAGGKVLRDKKGNPRLRPGGHGALIHNLNRLDADLAFVKNIDNVAPASRSAESMYWKRVLGGFLLRQQSLVFRLLEKLRDGTPGAVAAAESWAAETLGTQGVPEADREKLRSRLVSLLNRPIRVCGVVINRGEPGGGPFWVREPRGASRLQIVESAQIDLADPRQAAAVAASTHFNPVDMVCGLRDFRGRAFQLVDFANPDTCFVTTKNLDGRPLTALEWPGLWNGGMHDWLTCFVEIPESTFTPVKQVNDLLRPEHQFV